MEITNVKTIKKQKVSSNLFTGRVEIATPFEDIDNIDTAVNFVSFSEGVHNKFHKHSQDQILIVTQGRGFVATKNERYEVKEGDIIWTPAGEVHQHGALPGHTFTHISITKSNTRLTQVEK